MSQHILITAANMQREYILNVPTNYDQHLLPLSDNSTIFVAPNGQDNGANCTSEDGCGWPNPNDSDILLSDAIVAQVEQNFCVDTSRIFATGWSYGASMSYEAACERPLGGTTNGVNGYIRGVAVYSAGA